MQRSKIGYQPLVTVVTVVYNAVDLIEATIKSVLGQSYSNLEYIVIDGGSTDGTCAIIEQYKEKIACYVSEPDNGIYDAMNKGVKLSKGEWVNFMNAGDEFYNVRVIEDVMKVGPFASTVKVLYGDMCLKIQGQTDIIKHHNNINKNVVQYSLNHQSTFVNGDWMRSILYDTSFKIAADANLFNETAKKGYDFQYVPVIVSNYEASNGVSSVNQLKMFREFVRIRRIKKYSLSWWRGYLKAQFFNLLHKLPLGMGDKALSEYIKFRIR